MIPPSMVSRRGMALVLVIGIMTLLLALATSLTDLTVSSMNQSSQRQSTAMLATGTESLANLGLAYLQQRTDLEALLASMRTAGPQELIYGFTTGGDRYTVNTTLAESASQTLGGRPALNGIDPALNWTYVSTVNVEVFGTRTAMDLFRLSATGGYDGPARLYVSGNERAIQKVNTYRRRRVEVLFTPYPTMSFRQAMYARKGFQFMGSATTDSWNSNNGAVTYAGGSKGAHGDLTSEGDIVVQKSSNVQGTVTPNTPIPLPTLAYNPTGSETPLPGPSIGAYTAGGPLATGRYRASTLGLSSANSITFVAGADVTIYVDGPISITKTWDMRSCGNPSRVVIIQNNYDSSLGGTTFNGRVTVGNPDKPSSFQFYSLYDGKLPDASNQQTIDFKLNGTAVFGGILMAPYANFQLNGTFDFYGALIADSFKDATDLGKVNGTFSFHYDESLGQVAAPFPPTLVVVGWNSLDVPPAEWRNRSAGIRWDDP